MNTSAHEGPHLRLIVGGIAAMLLGGSGIAAVMAFLPGATEMPRVGFALDAPASTASGRRAKGARVRCEECGIVASMREVESPDAGIDSGTTGVASKAERNKVSAASTRSYEVVVRMKDGSNRVFRDANPEHWRPGERVILIGGLDRENESSRQ